MTSVSSVNLICIGDLSDTQVRFLAAARTVSFGGTRAEILEKLVAKDSTFSESNLVSDIPPDQLRIICEACSVNNSGTREEMAIRLKDKADSENIRVEDKANLSPKGIEILTLNSLHNKLKITSWQSDVRLALETRDLWFAKFEKLVESSTTATEKANILAAFSPRERQDMVLLLQGMRKSLNENLRGTLIADLNAGTLNNDAASLWLWVNGYQQRLGSATQTRALKQFQKSCWAKSKKDIVS